MSNEEVDKFFNSEALNENFFTEIIQRKLNLARDAFKIKLIMIFPATSVNDNFISVIYRAKIKIEIVQTQSLRAIDVILKCSISQSSENAGFQVFPREKLVYEEILEKYEKIWKEQASESVQFGPKCWSVVSRPYEIIALDDLKAESYELVKKETGVNLQQAKVVLSTFAKLHAASAFQYQKV
jgi:Ecdysteroid kinase-like family